MAGKAHIRIDGDDALIAKLKALNKHVMHNVAESLQKSAEKVRNRAVQGIAKGPKTGRIYTHRFPSVFIGGRMRAVDKRARPHQASAPGEYPAGDTGNLMNSIFTDEFVEPEEKMTAEVWADAAYAKPLEYKPPHRGGRPFLRRALMEEHADTVGGVVGAIVDAIRETTAQPSIKPPVPLLTGPPAPRLLTGPRPPRRLTGPPRSATDDLNRDQLRRLLGKPDGSN